MPRTFAALMDGLVGVNHEVADLRVDALAAGVRRASTTRAPLSRRATTCCPVIRRAADAQGSSALPDADTRAGARAAHDLGANFSAPV
jgi:hypothetical protein